MKNDISKYDLIIFDLDGQVNFRIQQQRARVENAHDGEN